MKIVVDVAKCAGNGICEGLDPERFQIQSDNKVTVLHEAIDDEEALEGAREAVELCPAEALRIAD